MSADAHGHDRLYYVIWAALLVALGISLALGALTGSPFAVAAIFAIAGVKAWSVVAYFMHLSIEPRHLKLVVTGALAVVGTFLVGVFPDVAGGWAVLPPPDPGVAVVPAHDPGGPGDAARGEKVYTTFCASCHMADGRGNGGTTAADFVADPARLGKTDDELLESIEDGMTGPVGAMPPWKAALPPQQRRDALAYIRATFGKAH